MIRCKCEVMAAQSDKQTQERSFDGRRLMRRVGWDDLMKDAGQALRSLRQPCELRAVAKDAERRLRPADFSRFVAWIEQTYGTAFARQGGLAVGAPRLTLAS